MCACVEREREREREVPGWFVVTAQIRKLTIFLIWLSINDCPFTE